MMTKLNIVLAVVNVAIALFNVWVAAQNRKVAHINRDHSEQLRLFAIIVNTENINELALQPVAEVVAGNQNLGAVKFTGPIPRKGTKLYAVLR